MHSPLENENTSAGEWRHDASLIRGQHDEIEAGLVAEDADTAAEHLDDYLDQLTAELLPLPRQQRRGIRQEVRQHLLAMIDAHREMGLSHSAAAEAACDRFGEPRRLGRNMRRVFEETHLSTATRRSLRWGEALLWAPITAQLGIVLVATLWGEPLDNWAHACLSRAGYRLFLFWVLPAIGAWLLVRSAPSADLLARRMGRVLLRVALSFAVLFLGWKFSFLSVENPLFSIPLPNGSSIPFTRAILNPSLHAVYLDWWTREHLHPLASVPVAAALSGGVAVLKRLTVQTVKRWRRAVA